MRAGPRFPQPRVPNFHGRRTARSSRRRRSICRGASKTAATSIDDMRPLAILGDGVTTDTLSPNGAIMSGTPAARFLGRARRRAGQISAIMPRGAAAMRSRCAGCSPIRISKTKCCAAGAARTTLLMPEGEQTTIFEAGMAYVARGTPAIIIAGKGLRQRFVARLGGEGLAASRRARRIGGILRAHPPRQSRRRRHPAADLRAGIEPQDPRPDRARTISTCADCGTALRWEGKLRSISSAKTARPIP